MAESVTIEQAREKKHIMEKYIKDLLIEFETCTGLKVEGVCVSSARTGEDSKISYVQIVAKL